MSLSVIVPCHNEEKNIGPLLESLLKFNKELNLNFELIFVDDNSTDNTYELIKKYQKKNPEIKIVKRNKGNNGMGFALKDGTKCSKGEYIVWIMGDKSDDLRTIPAILDKLKNGYDMVFASRYMKGASRGNLSLIKALMSSSFTVISRFVFGIKVHDITNAFRGFKRNVFDSIDIKAGDFAISPEFAIKAHKRGFKLGEVPTVYTDRIKGKSKFFMIDMGRSYSKLLLLRFKK